MAKWAAEEWDSPKEDTKRILVRIRRVSDIIHLDAVCKSRPTVRDKAEELLTLVDLLESKLDEYKW